MKPVLSSLLGLALVLAAGPNVAAAEEPATGSDRRWIPGASFITGALVHARQGAVESPERGSDSG